MRNGASTSFISTPVLPNSGLITKKYLQELEQAIKQRTPIAGGNIEIKITDGSYVISASDGDAPAVLAGAGYTDIKLTVCSGGEPAEIFVLAKEVSS